MDYQKVHSERSVSKIRIFVCPYRPSLLSLPSLLLPTLEFLLQPSSAVPQLSTLPSSVLTVLVETSLTLLLKAMPTLPTPQSSNKSLAQSLSPTLLELQSLLATPLLPIQDTTATATTDLLPQLLSELPKKFSLF